MKGFVVSAAVVVALVVGAIWWSTSLQSNDVDILARNGIHWHPELSIVVQGEKQIIPADIGIGRRYSALPSFDSRMGMTAIHTHDDASQGIIHLEFNGVVRRQDITLGQFLEIWGRDIDSFGADVTMTVTVNRMPISATTSCRIRIRSSCDTTEQLWTWGHGDLLRRPC